MRDKPVGGKKKNLGSPTDAAQRSVRTLYGRAVASSSRDASTKKRVTALQNASGRGGSEGPKRGMTAGRSMGAAAGSEGPKKRTPKANLGSPTAAAQRQAISRAAGSPTAAAERQKRATTYGPTGGAQPRPTRSGGSKPKVNPGSPLAAYQRQKRATTYGPTGGSQPKANLGSPSDAAARSRSKGMTDKQMIAEQRKLQAKLKGVDYAALGRLMRAKGYKGKGWDNLPFK